MFNAIAEPRRRRIIGLLGDTRARPVADVAEFLRLPQPSVSKHLGVLRRVGARLGHPARAAAAVSPEPEGAQTRERLGKAI